MFYKFPTFTINDVYEAIAGRDEFIAADRGDFVIFNYNVNFIDTFPAIDGTERERFLAAVRRECRGLTFYKDGRIAARKYHKFFNLDERAETQMHLVDLSQSHMIMEKLDGSMISSVLTPDNHVQFHTKMGYTDIAEQAQQFAERGIRRVQDKKVQAWYNDFAHDMMKSGMTPLFEWCSRKQRIVIDHPVDDLILTGVRRNETGQYLTYDQMCAVADPYKIPVVSVFVDTDNIQTLKERVRGLTDTEGFVVRFDSGHMLKLKCEWYCNIHGAVSELVQEKNIWRMALNNELDDVKPFLEQDQRDRLDRFEKDLHDAMISTTNLLDDIFNDLKRNVEKHQSEIDMFDDPDRARQKIFATAYVPNVDKKYRPMLFRMWNGADAYDLVSEHVLKNTGTATKIDEMREFLDTDLRFRTYNIEED